MMPKYSTEKTNSAAVGAVLEARDGTILDVVRKIKPYSIEEA